MAGNDKAPGRPAPGKDKIKIERLFEGRVKSREPKPRAKLLSLPSGKLGAAQPKRKLRKRKTRTVRRDVTFMIDELDAEIRAFERVNVDSSESSESWPAPSGPTSTESDCSLGADALSEGQSTELELGEIYSAIDEVNKICLDPIKVKLRRDFLEAKRGGAADARDVRYSADINIVLSSRSDPGKAQPSAPEKGPDDFSVVVESVSDSSKSELPFRSLESYYLEDLKPARAIAKSDSVRSLDEASQQASVANAGDSGDAEGAAGAQGAPASAPGAVSDRPYYGRTLFYRFHSPSPSCCFPNDCRVAHPFRIQDPSCLSPAQLGFDSAESFNNSLNAPSEVIIKPPVTIGRAVSFRSNVCKSVLARDRFIADAVFQIDWVARGGRRRRRPFLACCEA